MKKPIGILGGMGPGAGVYFKQLIISITPSMRDQNHLPILLYTNPQIPDRTTAILNGTPSDFVKPICDSLLQLEQFGVSEIFIPCNTSFVGLSEYRRVVKTPIFDLPGYTCEVITAQTDRSALLFATVGTYAAGVYTQNLTGRIVYPEVSGQKMVHALISAVKAGDVVLQGKLLKQIAAIIPDQATPVILGCTELSLLAGKFRIEYPGVTFVDPLELAAQYVVNTYSVKAQAVGVS